ncbi:MAG: hypothetical protein R3A52_20820 [Polyangiales bacterium]
MRVRRWGFTEALALTSGRTLSPSSSVLLKRTSIFTSKARPVRIFFTSEAKLVLREEVSISLATTV